MSNQYPLPPAGNPQTPVTYNGLTKEETNLNTLSTCWYVLAVLVGLPSCLGLAYVIFGIIAAVVGGAAGASANDSGGAAAGVAFGGIFACIGGVIRDILGTGLGPRDITPQVLDGACDYGIPGFGELLRQGSLKYSLNAYLSRCGGWVKGRTLVLALPGNPKAVVEQLDILADLLPHALKSLQGKCDDRRKTEAKS